MKIFAPDYFGDFKCLMGDCKHSCCIGWEIDIDENAMKKYNSLRDGYGEIIKGSISTDGTPHFKLGKGDRCPHLNECGLCEIILNIGEDHLCDICREHPRFYNYTSIAEVGLGMSCIEAARLILSSPDYAETEEVGEVDAAPDEIDFDGINDRRKIYEILQTADNFASGLDKIYRVYETDAKDDATWLEILDYLEYLDPDHKKLFMSYSSSHRPLGKDEYSERFLAYLIYRHCTEAFDPEDFRNRLSFCLFCEKLFSSLILSENAQTLDEIARLASIISEEIEYCDENTFALMQ